MIRKEEESIETNKNEIPMWRWVKLIYPPDEEETIQRFKQWCKEYAGNRFIVGIKTLMYLADQQSQMSAVYKKLAELEARLNEIEGKDDDGIQTMGGSVK